MVPYEGHHPKGPGGEATLSSNFIFHNFSSVETSLAFQMRNRSQRTRDKTRWMKLGHWNTGRRQKVNFATFGAIMKTFVVPVWLLVRSSGHLGRPRKPPEEHLQPRKMQNTCAYDFESDKNDPKMEPRSSKNGSKMNKMAPKWSPKQLPWRPPNGPEGFKMVQDAPKMA